MGMHPVTGAALAQAALSPRSVALIGASDDPGKAAGRPLLFMRRIGYAGALYPINPRRETVQGERAWPSVAALPAVPEHAYILTPTETVLESVADCARAGVKVVSILASGFSESGAEGIAREAELGRIARDTGIRVIGPSSLGIAHPAAALLLTANAAFAEPELPRGRVFVASHSGSMIGALLSRGKARGVGFAGLISVGGEVDVSLGEICMATLDDPGIDGYLLFLESLRNGAWMRAFAIAAHRRGKPVIAYKLGRSAAAAEMTATHTGALAGEDDVADAFLKDCGIARLGVLESLIEAFPLARRLPVHNGTRRRQRVGVVTTTGGGAAMVVDQLGIRDVTVEPATPATLARFAAAGIAVLPGRVLDLTLAGARYEVMKKALDLALEAPEFDLVVAVIGSSARFNPEQAIQPIIDLASHAKPLAAMLVPDAPQALVLLTAAGVPCFHNPEACADSIAAMFARRTPHALACPAPPAGEGRAVSEAEAYAVMDALGVPHAPALVIKLDADPPQLPFPFPVVAKICSAQVPHKTEVGGVILGVNSTADLRRALATLRENVTRAVPGIHVEDALIQPWVRGLAEVLVGYRVDAQAGPLVMLAAGGIWAELVRDRSIRLAPVDVATAHQMIGEVHALKGLSGLRGRPRGDLDALARAVSALSQLAMRSDLRVTEAEVNPLLVMAEGDGVLAVDALVMRN